jgi:ABC-type polysaccharide/polyol phosphate transport system ATPase subunit
MIDVRVRNVSKHFRVPAPGPGRRRMLGLLPRRETFWALRDVSFEVRRGEALGVIGPNGSGKSTLIRLLSGISAPSAGEIEINGRLASLVEVGAGFQPDLTGRENVFLNGAILGMGTREIARKLPEIVAFAEVGAFLDMPVKRYSSGMFVRLGFAIAAHLDADILLLDEVLAVGDAAFQARCFRRVEELRRAGRTVLLVSHDLDAVERVCGRALLLGGGRIVREGETRRIVEAYQESLRLSFEADAAEVGGPVAVAGLEFGAGDGGAVRTGAPFRCRVSLDARERLDGVQIRVSFIWPSGYLCTELVSDAGLAFGRGAAQLEFDCPVLTMQRGLYGADVRVERCGLVLAERRRCAILRVAPGRMVEGDFYMPHSVRNLGALAKVAR